MRTNRNIQGFSLIEVLMAVGTLAIGMIFIGGTFLVGIHFSTIATERTIAAVAADEAFAKVRIFGVNLADPNFNVIDQQVLFKGVVSNKPLNPNEFAYPSIKTLAESRYCWSALCRRVNLSDPNVLQVTVFVSRRVGISAKYRNPVDPFDERIALTRPVPLRVDVSANPGDVLTIKVFDERIFINDGYTIIENSSGRIYRVVERAVDSSPLNEITLAQPWQGGDTVWVVPPPFGGGRGPCIAVYQKTITF